MRATPDPEREPERLYELIAPVLAAETLDSALHRAAEACAAMSGAPVCAVFMFGDSGVTGEGWSPARDSIETSVRAAVRRAARPLAEPEAGETPEGSVRTEVWTLPVRSAGRPVGSLCGTGPAPSPGSLRRLSMLLDVLAPRIVALLETLRGSAARAQYERWFRTLDEQLRVLDRERQKFAAMVHQADAAVYVADSDGVVIWTNAVLSGLSPAGGRTSWLGLTCDSVCSYYGHEGAGPRCAECPARRAYESNEVAHGELRSAGEHGTRNHYLTAIPIKGPDGRPHEVMVMVQDLTGLESVKRAEERLRAVVSNAPIVLFAIDAQGVFTMSEGHGLAALGLKPGEVVGRSAYEIYSDVPQVCDDIRRALGGEEFTDLVSLGPLVFETRWTPVRGASGVTGLIGVANDVTEQHKLEAQLRQSQKMEAIGRLAGGVAHDFNNLLAAILGHTELMLARADAAHPLRSSLEEIQKAGARGALLTRQLLSFSRKHVLAPHVLDVNAVVAEMEGLLRRLIGEDIELATSYSPDPARVRVDRSQLEQVLMNLAVNARDALPNGGQVTIEVAPVELDEAYAASHADVKPGRYVMVSVSDNGCGMDEETMARAFEPFFTTKAVGKGTGLGLSTVYAIVEQTEGHIWLYSEPGLGATFKVYLPEVIETEAEQRPAGEPVVSLAGTETILLVEDEDAVRALVRDALVVHGYRVLEARNGAEAIWKLQDAPAVDLLVSDVVMPQMGGGELAQRLRDVRPDLRVLFMSGYPDDAIVRQGVIRDGTPFIQKPFTLEALARKVREVLSAPPASRAA